MYREKLTYLREEGVFAPRLLLEIGHKAEKAEQPRASESRMPFSPWPLHPFLAQSHFMSICPPCLTETYTQTRAERARRCQ